MFIDDWAEECEADQLLQRHGKLGADQGAYTEKQLIRHTKREHPEQAEIIEIVHVHGDNVLLHLAQTDLAAMVQSDLVKLGKLARLSDRHMDVWSLRARGLTVRDIAIAVDMPRSTVQDMLVRSRLRVLRALVMNPHFGLWEVYWELVHRF